MIICGKLACITQQLDEPYGLIVVWSFTLIDDVRY